MANDLRLPARRAVVEGLSGEDTITALVADRVYGPKVVAEPTWPFIRCEFQTSTPRLATGLDGSDIAVVIHCFAKGDDEGAAADLCAKVAKYLDGKGFALDADVPARLYSIRWQSTQVIPDGDEADAWHGIVQFRARIRS